jgi:hypothetical protein
MNEIICGNIGSVYLGSDDEIAQEKFNEYCHQSKIGYGRAAGEDVIWMRNGDIYREFTGSLTEGMDSPLN